MIVWFIRVPWVHSCATFRWSCSFRFVGCTRAHWWSGRAVGDVAFIRRVVGFNQLHSGTPWLLSGYISPCSGCRAVKSGSLCSFGGTVYVVGFIWVHSGEALGVAGFIWAHPGGRRVRLGSLGFFGRSPEGRWVHSAAPWVLSGSFGFVCAHPVRRGFHSHSLGSFGGSPVGRCVHSDAPWGVSGSFGFVGFILVCPWGRPVHWGWLRSFGRALGVVWFIKFHLVAYWGGQVHSCSLHG